MRTGKSLLDLLTGKALLDAMFGLSNVGKRKLNITLTLAIYSAGLNAAAIKVNAERWRGAQGGALHESKNKELSPMWQNFSLSPKVLEHYKELRLQEPTHCPGCRKKKRHIEYIPCKACGIPFPINELEIEFFELKGYAQPKRCPECRRKRREKEVTGK
jgi:hypothetical protein